MMAGVLLVGASGLAREVLAAGLTGVVGFLDDDRSLHSTEVAGVPVVGSIADGVARAESLLVCVGPSISRRRIVHRLRMLGVSDDRYATFVARSARIGMTSEIGRGSIVLEGVVVTADAAIGRHVVIMPQCAVTHDNAIRDFVTLAAGVSLGGSVRIGEAANVGMNASIRQGLTIGTEATVGMGAVVLDDVPDHQTWVGVPAHPLDVSA